METKVCTKCGVEKPLPEYYKHKGGKAGRDSRCKRCIEDARIYKRKLFVTAKKEEAMQKIVEYCRHSGHDITDVKICISCGEVKARGEYGIRKDSEDGRQNKCKVCRRASAREWEISKGDEWIKYRTDYAHANREKKREYDKQYLLRKRDSINDKNKRWIAKREATDPAFKLMNRVRGRMRAALKGKKANRSWTTFVDYTIADLKTHLERQFTKGMDWDNYGKWHVDHRTPVSSYDFTDEKEISECWALPNLQPLWAEENIKKSNKILYLL